MSLPLIIFAKAPVAGVAKTRLIPALGADGAAQLHARLLEHVVKQAVSSCCYPVFLYTPQGEQHPFIAQLLAGYPLIHHQQKGKDLGERMRHALAENNNRALLIGSDCPLMDAAILEKCCLSLETHDAVFLPAEDGGYTLVGLHQSETMPAVGAIFEGIEWGTDQVMQQTRIQLKKLSLRWDEPFTLWDVDRPQDLIRLGQQFPLLAGDVVPLNS